MKIRYSHILITLLLLVLSYHKGHTATDLTASNVTSVIDGDTFRANIKGYPDLLKDISIRIYGIDAPEIKGLML